MPANAGMFFGALTEMATFDILEIGDYVSDYLELAPQDPINEKFEAMGMEDKYFVNNVGSFFLILLFYCGLTIAWLIAILAQLVFR